MSAGGESRRAVIAALLANLGIAVAKFAGFAFTTSSAMLAEAVHSLADTGNQILLLVGAHRAKREATPLHPFGYGRERYFWAFVVAIVLFTLGAAFAIYEGVEKVLHPHELESPQWAIGILVVALVLEGLSFRTAVKESNKLRRQASWPSFIRNAKVPELPVVLLEDFGALIGLVLALAAVGLTIATGNAVWDGVGSLCIGTLLGVIAVVLAAEMKSLIIGESADPEVEAQIVAAVEAGEEVVGIIHLRTQHLSPDELLVATKAEFRADLAGGELAVAIDRVEARVRAAVPAARLIFVEPDVRRPVADA
ncbi:MAG: cation diffusion facilitator family transporter [Acidimicrobiales bacterium]